MMDFAQARRNMVEGQLRPNGLMDHALTETFHRTAREPFVPAELHDLAYSDLPVPLAPGRYASEPRVLAKLLQAALPLRGARVCVIGAGFGYTPALLAPVAASVVAVEEDPALVQRLRQSMPVHAPAVQIVEAALTEGAPALAPFDVIVIEGAVDQIPDSLRAQLADGGRLLAVQAGAPRALGVAFLELRVGEAFAHRPLFDCAVRPLAAFAGRAALAGPSQLVAAG